MTLRQFVKRRLVKRQLVKRQLVKSIKEASIGQVVKECVNSSSNKYKPSIRQVIIKLFKLPPDLNYYEIEIVTLFVLTSTCLVLIGQSKYDGLGLKIKHGIFRQMNDLKL